MKLGTVFKHLQGGANGIIMFCKAARAKGTHRIPELQYGRDGQLRFRIFLDSTIYSRVRQEWFALMNAYIDAINIEPIVGMFMYPVPHFEELLKTLSEKPLPTLDEELQQLEKAALEFYWMCGNFEGLLQLSGPDSRYARLLDWCPPTN